MTASLEATPTVGDSIGPVRVTETTLEDLVRWAGAIDDYSPIHYDAAEAAERGLRGVIVNGPWKSALLAELLSSWLGPHGTVQELHCQYRHPDVVGEGLQFAGIVTSVARHGAHDLLECDVWVENDGVRSVVGHATVRTNRPEEDQPAGDDGRVTLVGSRLRDALQIGEEAGRFTYRVEANDLERFAHAISGLPPSSRSELTVGSDAPPTYYAVVDPVERRELQLEEVLNEIPYVKTGGGNAFNEVEYERPIRLGDVLTVVTTYEDAYDRQGRTGRLLFRVRRNTIFDAAGKLVARSRMGHVLAYDLDRRVER